MAVKISELLTREKKPAHGLLAFEWVAIGYLLISLLMIVILWDKMVSPTEMLKGRVQFLLVTLACWAVYYLWP